MAAHVVVVVRSNSRSATQLAVDLDKSNKHRAATALQNFFKRVFGGWGDAFVTTRISGAIAAGYVDCDNSDAVNGTDELVIAGSVGATLAVEASPANQNEFAKGASDAAFATNLAAAINAHTTLSKIVRAYVDSGTANRVRIEALLPGLEGNLITLSETGNGFTLGAAALAGGTSDEADHMPFGYDPRV